MYTYKPEVKEITEVDIYGKQVECPKGYKIVGFRPVAAIDKWIGKTELNICNFYDHGWSYMTGPRLIVEKIKTKVITFRSTGETRNPKKGEYYLSGKTNILKALNDFSFLRFEIFTCTETEE